MKHRIHRSTKAILNPKPQTVSGLTKRQRSNQRRMDHSTTKTKTNSASMTENTMRVSSGSLGALSTYIVERRASILGTIMIWDHIGTWDPLGALKVEV